MRIQVRLVCWTINIDILAVGYYQVLCTAAVPTGRTFGTTAAARNIENDSRLQQDQPPEPAQGAGVERASELRGKKLWDVCAACCM